MRAWTFAIVVIVASCGSSPAYRDVNGRPYNLSFRCTDGRDAGLVDRRGETHACPDVFKVRCRQHDGAFVEYTVVDADSHGMLVMPPPSPDEMCARIAANR